MSGKGDGDTVPVQGEVELRFYTDEVDSVTIVFDGGKLPLTVGETFTGRVVAVTRRVTER